jgi:glycosyltransferase involved in cell wall biosynthesis
MGSFSSLGSSSPGRGSLSLGFFSPAWPAEGIQNGIATYVSTLVPALQGLGHQVSILAGQVKGGEASGPPDLALVHDVETQFRARSRFRRAVDRLWYEVTPQPAARSMARRAVVSAARRMAHERSLDVIEMEESNGWARWLQKSTSSRVSIRLHGPWFLAGPALGARVDREFRTRVRDEGRAISTADGVTAPSKDVLRQVRARYQISLDHAEVIPNPIRPVPEFERWRLDACDRSRVLFVGRFDRGKGGDLVIEAVSRVRREFPGVRLTIIGPDRGFADDRGRMRQLLEFVRDRLPGALESGSVEWLGTLPASSLAPLRRSAFVTIIPSRYENFPYTLTEAMATGCPVVAAGVGGILDMVDDGVNGLLHRAGDPADLGMRIVEMFREPERAAAMGRRAAADCERQLYPDVVAARMVDYYRRLLVAPKRIAG